MLSTRRLFLGSAVAAAMPLVIRGDAHAIAGVLPPPSRAPVSDPVLGELIRQLEELKQLAAAPAPRMGEIMRRHAANLRLQAAHGKTFNLDAKVRRQLKAFIDREGLGPFLRGAGSVDITARTATIEAILRTGVTPALLGSAAQLERTAATIDVRGPLNHVRGQLEDPCDNMRRTHQFMEISVIIYCAVGLLVGPELCIIMQLDLAVWIAYMMYMGCR